MTETNFDDTAQRQFERQALSFEQNFEQFRDLNRLMWQVPVLAITITGGFWYAVLAYAAAAEIARGLYLICGVLDLALIFVLIRIRYVMGRYLVKLKAFNPEGYVDAPGTGFYNRSYVVVIAFCFSLFVAAFMSIASFFDPQFRRG